MNNRDFSGRLVVSFESRRATEMASLIERHGGVAVAAPSLREVSTQGAEGDLPEGARKLADALASGAVDVLVFLTGTGVRGFVEAVRPRLDPEAFVAALGAL